MAFLLFAKRRVRGMNQKVRDDLAIYLGLQEFEVMLVETRSGAASGAQSVTRPVVASFARFRPSAFMLVSRAVIPNP
jgi:hypothetical protein